MSDKLTVMQRTYIAELLHISERLATMGVQTLSPAGVGGKQYTFVYLDDDPTGAMAAANPSPLDEETGSETLTVALHEAKIILMQCRPAQTGKEADHDL